MSLTGSPASFLRCLALLAALCLAGCGRNDIQVYRVAKESPPQPAQTAGSGSAMGSQMPAQGGAEMPRLTWTLPAGWEEAAAGEMRVASFKIQKEGKEADLGIVPLPGLVGHDLENVNRWRSTVGLPAASEDDLKKLAEPVEMDGGVANVYDQAGENPGSGDKTRILAAVLRREGVAWFFKMNGDDDLVAKEKPNFISFLKSVKFQAGAGGGMMAAGSGELPPSHPPIGGMPAASADAAPPSTEGKPSWAVPAGWQETPGGPFLLAKFNIAGAGNAQAAVNVSMSAGDGGGLVANVNRWRKQLGLTDLSEADLEKQVAALDTTAGKASVVDMAGTDARSGQAARLVGVMAPQGGRTWFYKLMGAEPVVAREKDAFLKFVRTAKYQE